MICDRLGATRLDPAWLKARAEEEVQEANRRRRVYLEGRPPLDAGGKVAIVVDDGVATGLTILLAIMVLKGQHPQKIVVAVPVSSPEAAQRGSGQRQTSLWPWMCPIISVPYRSITRNFLS